MRVSVVSEQVFSQTPDGQIWSVGVAESFWKRYLDVFDQLRIIARVQGVPERPPGGLLLADPRICFAKIPFYRGSAQLLRRAPQVRSALRRSYSATDALVLRVPSTLANLMLPAVRGARHPYAVEVVGDPQDVFGSSGIAHAVRPLLRHWYSRHQRTQCQEARAVAYVTQGRLQSRYPASETAFTTHYSSLDLPDEAFAAQSRSEQAFDRSPLRLMTVASLSQLYKAPEVLIDAVDLCLKQGLDLRLEIVGEGIYRKQLEQQVQALGLRDRISFRGQIPSGEPVWDRLDASQLFVLPSRTEGLPRAMIEAMARGLPCIGSTAGGIPELLPEDFLVKPGSRDSLFKCIAKVCTSPALMSRMSEENLESAQEYRPAVLQSRRQSFYRYLHKETFRWSGRQAA